MGVRILRALEGRKELEWLKPEVEEALSNRELKYALKEFGLNPRSPLVRSVMEKLADALGEGADFYSAVKKTREEIINELAEKIQKTKPMWGHLSFEQFCSLAGEPNLGRWIPEKSLEILKQVWGEVKNQELYPQELPEVLFNKARELAEKEYSERIAKAGFFEKRKIRREMEEVLRGLKEAREMLQRELKWKQRWEELFKSIPSAKLARRVGFFTPEMHRLWIDYYLGKIKPEELKKQLMRETNIPRIVSELADRARSPLGVLALAALLKRKLPPPVEPRVKELVEETEKELEEHVRGIVEAHVRDLANTAAWVRLRKEAIESLRKEMEKYPLAKEKIMEEIKLEKRRIEDLKRWARREADELAALFAVYGVLTPPEKRRPLLAMLHLDVGALHLRPSEVRLLALALGKNPREVMKKARELAARKIMETAFFEGSLEEALKELERRETF